MRYIYIREHPSILAISTTAFPLVWMTFRRRNGPRATSARAAQETRGLGLSR
jgi:hypothetical protein